MSVRARRKNLRQYELTSGDLQGSPELLVRAAQNEALAPSSPTIGVVQDAIALLVFKIPANAPNVPEMLPTAMDPGADPNESVEKRRAEKAGKFRVAVHAIIHSPETSDVSDAQLEHSSHCMPNPLEIPNITAEQYLFWSKKYPIYVGDFIEDNSEEVGGQGRVTRGSAIRVRDNDVQGGIYGSIMEVMNTPLTMPEFGQGPLHDLFGPSSTPIVLSDGSIAHVEPGQNIIDILKTQTLNAEEGGVFVGDDLSLVTDTVMVEIMLWETADGEKRDETDPAVQPVLANYWENAGITAWDPVGDPWSAVFISYIVSSAGGGLTPRAAHWEYCDAASRGQAGYGLLTADSSAIFANIGDILVKRRAEAGDSLGGGKTATGYETHGDIVYEIDEAAGVAYLAGGNLGNTAVSDITVGVDSDGYYSDYGEYEIIVKKNARFDDGEGVSYA